MFLTVKNMFENDFWQTKIDQVEQNSFSEPFLFQSKLFNQAF